MYPWRRCAVFRYELTVVAMSRMNDGVSWPSFLSSTTRSCAAATASSVGNDDSAPCSCCSVTTLSNIRSWKESSNRYSSRPARSDRASFASAFRPIARLAGDSSRASSAAQVNRRPHSSRRAATSLCSVARSLPRTANRAPTNAPATLRKAAKRVTAGCVQVFTGLDSDARENQDQRLRSRRSARTCCGSSRWRGRRARCPRCRPGRR